MTFDISAQGWTAFINGVVAFLFLIVPQLKARFENQPAEYQASQRGILSLVVALLFVGGSCVGLWDDIACAKADILSFFGNVVIAGVIGFKVSGSVFHVSSTVGAYKEQKALNARLNK